MPLLTEYNKLLDRQRKGAQYLDNPNIPLEEREKWKGEYAKILKRLSELYKQLGRKSI
jgi:hypothetical protein